MSTRLIIFIDIFLLLIFVFLFSLFFYPKLVVKNTDAKVLADKMYNLCRSNWHECYKKELSAVARKYSFSFAEKTLNELQQIDPESRNCHVLAHFMSREAVRQNPERWNKLLNEVSVNVCGSGFLHGVLEAYMGINPDFKIDALAANDICGNLNESYRQRMCYHFMGHVFLLEQEGAISKALEPCRNIENPVYRFECFDGVFMEDHQKLALVEHGIAKEPEITGQYIEGLRKKCISFENTEEGAACWQEMAEMYAKLYAYDISKVYEGCYAAPVKREQEACYFKGIIIASIYTGYDTSDSLRPFCAPYENRRDDTLYKRCISFIHSGFMYYSPHYINRGIALCESAPESKTDWCFSSLTAALVEIVPKKENRTQFCSLLPKKYTSVCN